MSHESLEDSGVLKTPKDIYMNADTVDQVNTNQQSNMALSTGSIITQSYFLINTAGIEDMKAGGTDA